MAPPHAADGDTDGLTMFCIPLGGCPEQAVTSCTEVIGLCGGGGTPNGYSTSNGHTHYSDSSRLTSLR